MYNFFDATDPVNSTIDAERNYVYAPDKVVALVGVNDLVVVDTGDCLLITMRERAQDVGKVVQDLKWAEREGLV
jgi:mannose-1-phosphate guanylyltransferase